MLRNIIYDCSKLFNDDFKSSQNTHLNNKIKFRQQTNQNTQRARLN